MAVFYLDVDDEITTAVARLRSSPDYRVALVLPAGSHVATSRINFRLLAREAQNHQRRLAVVTPEAPVRAIAVAAGLPAYGTVGEYEAALADELAASRGGAGRYADEAARSEAGSRDAVSPTPPAPERAADVERGGPPGSPLGAPPGAREPERPPAAEVEGAAESSTTGPPLAGAGAGAGTGQATTRGRSAGALPVVKGEARPTARRGPSRRVLALVVAVLVLAAAAGVGAYYVLPAATITVTPVAQAVGPITLTVTADPSVTSVDTAGGVVPATSVSVPLSAQASFPATGVKVTLTSATGTVVFTSNNTVDAVSIPAGTTVSTSSGIQFETTASVTVPKATISGTTITAGQASAPVKAATAGPGGNVPAGAITVVPTALATLLVPADRPAVDNPDPTSGGKRTETKEVSQQDYAGALKSLTTQLGQQLPAAPASPSTAPAGLTLVKGTASLGSVTADQPASAVVRKPENAFTLAASASAIVLGIDEQQVSSLAQARLEAAVTPGDQLFGDSVKVTVGTPAATSGQVTVPVKASAEEWRPVVAAELLPKVKGRPVSEARSILAPYGVVKIQTWPGWVDTIPSLDARVDLVVTAPQRTTP